MGVHTGILSRCTYHNAKPNYTRAQNLRLAEVLKELLHWGEKSQFYSTEKNKITYLISAIVSKLSKIPTLTLSTDVFDPIGKKMLIEQFMIPNFYDAITVKPMENLPTPHIVD
jgi:DNA topoisomerase VI subunit B